MWIGRYEVIGELGRGGMGSVSLARSPTGALVVLKRPLEPDPDLCERLRDEARVGMRLSHPNVVETLDLFEHEGLPVLVVSYVSGASMHDLRLRGALPAEVICRVGRQVADALDALHHATDERGNALGMLHRDVTPGNVLLGHDGNARLIDLGIARSLENRAQPTRTGFMRGTLRYLAPELFDNRDASSASDLWSLGLVLLEGSLGRQMFRGTDAEIVGKIIAGKCLQLEPGESLDGRIEKALRGLLRQAPEARPARAREAAAVFAMLEKELPDSEGSAQRAVAHAVGPPKVYDADGPARATRQLMRSAAAAFVAEGDRLFGDEETLSDDGATTALGSAETERLPARTAPRGLGAPSLPQLEATAYFSSSALRAEELPADSGAPKTPGEELLAYAQKLRGIERTPLRTETGEGGRTGEWRATDLELSPPEGPADEPANALPVIGPVANRVPRRPPPPLPPGSSFDAWSLAPTVAEAGSAGSFAARPLASHGASPRRARGLGATALGLTLLGALAAAFGAREAPRAATDVVEAPAPVAPATPVPAWLHEAAPASPTKAAALAENERTAAPPDCFRPGRTRLLAYRDARGAWVTARHLAEVPERFRAEVRCIE